MNNPDNLPHSLKDMKALIRKILAAHPEVDTESAKRSLVKSHNPFRPSEARYHDFQKALQGVLSEKPTSKIIKQLGDLPDHLKDWASKLK